MDLGINLGGAEVVQNTSAGVNYDFPTETQIDYYAAEGFSQIRLPIAWENLQPTLNGGLDPTYLAQIQSLVTYADSRGMSVIIDIHNYGAYDGNLIGSSQVPVSAFANMWGQLAQQFVGQSNVVFDLMNEPQQASASAWLPAVNAAIGAIRDVGATQQVLVSGIGWDGGQSFTTDGNSAVLGAPGAIVDPDNNFAFEVHQYLDDTSGQNDWVVSPTIGVDRLEAVTEWARASGYKLYLGEFGVAANASSLTAMTNMLNFVQANQDVWEGAAYFAGGNVPSNYMYSVEPELGIIDKAQMAVLESYADAKTTLTALGNGMVEADTFVGGSDVASMKDILDSTDTVIARSEYDPDGVLERTIVKDADGGFTVTTYQTSDAPAASANLKVAAFSLQAAASDTPQVSTIEVYNAAQQRISETTWAADGTSEKDFYDAVSGATTRQEYYDANGVMTQAVNHTAQGHVWSLYQNGVLNMVQTFSLDWTLEEQDTYSPNGTVITRQIQNADGHVTVEQFSATNGLITSRAEYTSNWKLMAWASYSAKGQQQSVTSYDLNGSITTIELDNVDGSHSLQTFTAANQSHAQTLDQYSAANVLVSRTTMDQTGNITAVDTVAADGSYKIQDYDPTTHKVTALEVYSTKGVQTSLTKYDASGAIASVQLNNADGTHTLQNFAASDALHPLSVGQYDANWNMVSWTDLNAAGAVTTVETPGAGGSHTLKVYDPTTHLQTGLEVYAANWTLETRTDFDANGAIASIQMDNADGTHTMEAFTASNQANPQTIGLYDANWNMISWTTLDGAGHITQVNSPTSDGGRTIQDYDPTSHLKTSVETYSADWTLETQTKFDASGAVISVQTNNAGGSESLSVSSPVYVAAAGITGITLTGSAQTVTGNGTGDTFNSNNTGNHLIGGAGADTFILGGGGDVATGGGGKDTFVVKALPATASHITDFNPAMDVLDLTGLLTQSHYTGSNAIGDGYLKITADSFGDAQIWSETPGSAWLLVTTLNGVSASGVHLHGDLIFG